MQSAVCLLLLSSFTVLHGLQQPQPIDAPETGLKSRLETSLKSRPETRLGSERKGAGLTDKLLRLDALLRKDNDVMEPKSKRGFSGNSAPLDRLSVGGSSMEANQSPKTSKASEAPRKKAAPPPIDRIGTSRLPGNKG